MSLYDQYLQNILIDNNNLKKNDETQLMEKKVNLNKIFGF